MRDNPRRGMDPVVVKAFINLTGIYPVGTLVVLDTFELGIVHAVNPIPDMLSRPIVRIISDAQGNLLHPGHARRPRRAATRTACSCARSSRRRIPIDMASGSATISSDAHRAALRRAPRAAGRRALVPYVTAGPSRRRAQRRAAAGARGRRRRRHRGRRAVLRSDGRRPGHPGELADGARAGHDASTACSRSCSRARSRMPRRAVQLPESAAARRRRRAAARRGRRARTACSSPIFRSAPIRSARRGSATGRSPSSGSSRRRRRRRA